MTSKAERDAFTRGFAIACSMLVRGHNEDGYAEFLLQEANYGLDDLKAAGVEEYDLGPLRPVLREIEARRSKQA